MSAIHLHSSATDKYPACLRTSGRYAYPPRFGWDCTSDPRFTDCYACKRTEIFRQAVHAQERAKVAS